jgi:hypothetical protein
LNFLDDVGDQLGSIEQFPALAGREHQLVDHRQASDARAVVVTSCMVAYSWGIGSY